MEPKLKMILPKGRIQEKVTRLLERIGLAFRADGRSYRPVCGSGDVAAKILKPQNIPNFVALGRHDCGFTGHDWVVEQEADVVELLDLGYDPVRIVAAVPEELARDGAYRKKRIVVASEYRRLAGDYIRRRELDAVFVQTFGATEALPPEDADLIVDNTATGETLRRNRLEVVEVLMESTTRFVCNREVYEDPERRERLDELVMLMRSAIYASEKVLLEMNVPGDRFEGLVRELPCMRAPTVAPLHNGDGFAVKIAVPADDVRALIPKLLAMGARDILEYRLEKIVV
jgi:ATP phosphoribosyltransferase